MEKEFSSVKITLIHCFFYITVHCFITLVLKAGFELLLQLFFKNKTEEVQIENKGWNCFVLALRKKLIEALLPCCNHH